MGTSYSAGYSKILGRKTGQRGWLVARRRHSPPFKGGVAAPLIKRSRSLAAQTGWLVKGRAALLILFEITNHPVCAAKDASRLLLIAQPPLLFQGGEWGPLEIKP